MPAGSTVAQLVNLEEEAWDHVRRRRRMLHLAVSGFLAALMLLAVLDAFDVVDQLGPDERHVAASGGGFELDVEYPSVTRPALASVFRITVGRDSGFDEPVQVAVSRQYLEAWDLNGILPAPAAETADGRWIIWEFDPPPGDELTITYESRIEPGEQDDVPGHVAVMVEDEPVARVRFTTEVRP